VVTGSLGFGLPVGHDLEAIEELAEAVVDAARELLRSL